MNMMMEEACDCAHEQAGQRRLDSLRPTGASTCVVRVQALSLVAVRNNPPHRTNKKAREVPYWKKSGGSTRTKKWRILGESPRVTEPRRKTAGSVTLRNIRVAP